MKLNILSNEEMLGVSAEWLKDPQILAELSKDPLGIAVLKKIKSAHGSVATQTKLRAEIDAKLTGLNKRLPELDFSHDRNARALHNLLAALAEATTDEERAELYNQLRALLFPEGLRIITRPYIHEAGAIVGLETRVTPEILRQLESIRVGDLTLADLYQRWVEAGKALGSALKERASVQASISGDGMHVSSGQARKVRVSWIRAVRLLLDLVELLPLSDQARQDLLAPLVRTINEAVLRSGNGQSPVPADDDVDADADIDPDADADMDDYLDEDGNILDAAGVAPEIEALAELDEVAADPSIA
jgi:hypothetical protein